MTKEPVNWFPDDPPLRWGFGTKLQTWMARLFGLRVEGSDGRITTIGYIWRDRVYIVRQFTERP